MSHQRAGDDVAPKKRTQGEPGRRGVKKMAQMQRELATHLEADPDIQQCLQTFEGRNNFTLIKANFEEFEPLLLWLPSKVSWATAKNIRGDKPKIAVLWMVPNLEENH